MNYVYTSYLCIAKNVNSEIDTSIYITCNVYSPVVNNKYNRSNVAAISSCLYHEYGFTTGVLLYLIEAIIDMSCFNRAVCPHHIIRVARPYTFIINLMNKMNLSWFGNNGWYPT